MIPTPFKFEIGDRVRVRLFGGSSEWGIIRARYHVQGYPDYNDYGVELDKKRVIVNYSEDILVKDDAGYVFNATCTCGATKAYLPKPPPGHAYHCDLEKNRIIVKGK